ncbi:cytochrome P450 CYP736A12-like [Syzygium oleosum]|uniref:cytochrome P450 CYP736A12-like n=1 Tax=Syzygium oleosum TaxID=219896 RepID=UPI0011D1B11C|nr:cytochrome P450 CYP736A12-like [Syzygium oleosum]
METLDLAILLTALVTLYYFFLLLRLRHRNSKKLPPGPTALPIIGNLHQLRDLPHRRLHCLAKTYGPIMFLRLGNKPTVVVSSPEAAELVLKTHDAVFLGRPKGRVTHHLTYGNRGMAFTEGGVYWQSTRKLCALRLLSPAKVESYAPARREELGRLMERVRAAAAAREVVDVSAEVGELMGNLSCRLILGCGSNSGRDEFDLKPLIHEVLSLAGAFNLADYVPLLGPFDLQGLARRAKVIHRAIDKVLEGIIKEHEQDTTGKYKGDFLDTILSVMDQPMTNAQDKVDMLDRTNVKAIVLDLISGSYESSSTVMDWAFSELMRSPHTRKRLQQELRTVVGMNRMVEESDLSKLSYLDMVIKETFRLYPPGPLLIPHESTEDIEINGHYIPKRTQVIVNAWALGRDINAWADDVEEFKPERFANSSVDLKGRDFQLIPFGSGRRGCPGMNLALINTRLFLAQMVHCFDWELPEGMSPSDLDMTEEVGLSLSKAKHLFLVPSYRLLV